MNQGKARSSQLIIFDDGTLYHIDLKKTDSVPPNILLVGASDRVDLISAHFDKVTFQHRNKARPEFHTIAGTYNDVPVAAMSIGIGVGPVDIAINELHALFEYEHVAGRWTEQPAKVNIIRVGTCGSSLPDIPAGALAISKFAIGLDNLGAYYPIRRGSESMSLQIETQFLKTTVGHFNPCSYCSSASPAAVDALRRAAGSGNREVFTGITTASPGFFGPEGRQIGRIKTVFGPQEFRDVIQSFKVQKQRIINHEMETSILFRLGYEQLGYNVGAICLVVDNLATDEVITGDDAKERMNVCIRVALDSLIRL